MHRQTPQRYRMTGEVIVHNEASKGVQDIHIHRDSATGLIAVIALDKPDGPPALGGCRCIRYASLDDAIADAGQLAQAMSRKNHFSDLPFTGGKAVLMQPSVEFDREPYFKAFGRFVESLGGRFITGCDSGVSESDMRHAATQTRYITGFKSPDSDRDALSYLTALGVSRAMVAAAEFTLGVDDLSSLHVAVQGVGKVGGLLARIIRDNGGTLTICDSNAVLATRLGNELSAQVVDADAIYDVPCDIFAPCGIGGVLTAATMARLKARIVCGAANNPLHADSLELAGFDHDIVYVPDYIANAGGAMYAAGSYLQQSFADIETNVRQRIHRTIAHLCASSERDGVTLLHAANRLFAAS